MGVRRSKLCYSSFIFYWFSLFGSVIGDFVRIPFNILLTLCVITGVGCFLRVGNIVAVSFLVFQAISFSNRCYCLFISLIPAVCFHDDACPLHHLPRYRHPGVSANGFHKGLFIIVGGAESVDFFKKKEKRGGFEYLFFSISLSGYVPFPIRYFMHLDPLHSLSPLISFVNSS